ncbi:hypothetical protein [Actinacidiphila glaucinigra]|uniref:hypothetical protein n=1 Tax=Actinacidiphila glaucinigra TaxID=235986 RepID=UPI0035DFC245
MNDVPCVEAEAESGFDEETGPSPLVQVPVAVGAPVRLPIRGSSSLCARRTGHMGMVGALTGLRRGRRALYELGVGMAALAMAAGCSSSGDTSGGKPNGIEGQSVDRIFARVDKALDAASVHTVQVADGRQVGDVHALHGGDDCTGLFTDDQGFAWHFTTLGEHTWITPERRGAKLADRTGAPVEPGRYLPVELDSPGFAGELARYSSAACHLRFSMVKRQHVVFTKGAETRVNGRPALAVKTKQGSAEGTAYLATTGEPVPLRTVGHDGKKRFTTTWSDYGVSPRIAKPPKSKILPPLS